MTGLINPEETKMINGRPTITPDMLAPPNGSERLAVNFAVTIWRKLKEPLQGFKTVTGGLKVPTVDTEAEQELTQFELKWDRWPVPESYVDKALDDAKAAVKKTLFAKGLMK